MSDAPPGTGSRRRLLDAYLTTTYWVVEGETDIAVRVGVPSAEADALLARHGAGSAVFITAWNPRSRPQPPPVNEAAQRCLEAELRRQEIVCLPQRGVGSDSAWAPEHGVLALDLQPAAAVALAEAHGQNAIVVVVNGEPPRLVLTSLMPLD